MRIQRHANFIVNFLSSKADSNDDFEKPSFIIRISNNTCEKQETYSTYQMDQMVLETSSMYRKFAISRQASIITHKQ